MDTGSVFGTSFSIGYQLGKDVERGFGGTSAPHLLCYSPFHGSGTGIGTGSSKVASARYESIPVYVSAPAEDTSSALGTG
jgi:hypothetical protein